MRTPTKRGTSSSRSRAHSHPRHKSPPPRVVLTPEQYHELMDRLSTAEREARSAARRNERTLSSTTTRQLFDSPAPTKRGRATAFWRRANDTDYADAYPLSPQQRSADEDLDSVLVALKRRDPTLLQMSEETFTKSVRAEYDFFSSISPEHARQLAPRVRDALLLYTRDPALTASFSVETNPAVLCREWSKILQREEHRYEALVQVEREAAAGAFSPKPPAFVKNARKEVRKHSQSAREKTGKPPTAALDMTTEAESSDEEPPRRTKSKHKYDSDSEEDAPLPEIKLTPSNLEHVAMLKKAGCEVSRVGDRAIDWVATTFGTDPADLSFLLKGLPRELHSVTHVHASTNAGLNSHTNHS